MTRICYIIGYLAIGGAERQLYELVKRLSKNNFEPMVISLSCGGFWSEKIRQEGIEVIELQRKRHIEITRLLRLIGILRERKPHIVHTYLFPANSYGRIAAIITRVPITIASERSSAEIGKDKTVYQILVDKLLSYSSQGIICNSYKASETLIKKHLYDRNKVFAVHNGINPTDFSRTGDCDAGNKTVRKTVGTIGRLVSAKNHRLFLDVASNILASSEDENLKFMIVGGGKLRVELEEYSQFLGIKNNVIFMDERSDIPELLRSMDVFVITSLYEGLSNAIMEAMASGLPIVATDVGGNRELVVDGETGFLCPLNDVTAFTNRILELINDEDKAKQMGKDGLERLVNRFGIERMVKETERIYVKLLSQKSIS